MLPEPPSATLLGIVGNTAAGKTTLAQGVAAIIGRERCALICADDYHRYGRSERRRRGLSPADPANNHLDILEQHLALLRRGRPVLKPVYDHATGRLAAPEYVEPRPYVIVEGLQCYAGRGLRDCFDVKLFLEPEESLRARWKLSRDTTLRGYTAAEAEEALRRSKLDGKRFIEPQRAFADIVLGFFRPVAHEVASDARLPVRHLLRPTLPHPDLLSLVQGSLGEGLSLALARDGDGKPVDVLEIDGEIAEPDASRLEDLLWRRLPETSAVRARFGEICADRRAAVSHPLALSELLVAYHLETAAAEKRAARPA